MLLQQNCDRQLPSWSTLARAKSVVSKRKRGIVKKRKRNEQSNKWKKSKKLKISETQEIEADWLWFRLQNIEEGTVNITDEEFCYNLKKFFKPFVSKK